MSNLQQNNKFLYNISPGRLLYIARKQLGISRTDLAERMNIPIDVYKKYENCKLRIPNTLLIKIMMFGLDFWGDKMTWGIGRCPDAHHNK